MSRPAHLSARLARGARGSLLAVGTAVAVLGGASSAAADDATVHLTSVFAAPIKAAPTGTAAQDNRYLCDPEPSGRAVYGTDGVFDPTRAIDIPTGMSSDPGNVPTNLPSAATQATTYEAGVSNDLCFGFTLTPNVEPEIISGGYRLQDSPPLPDVADTHVLDADGKMTNGDDMDTVRVQMPEGFLGDPDGVDQCSAADFGVGNYKASTCASASQIGTAFVRLTVLASGNDSSGLLSHLLVGGGPNTRTNTITSGGRVFNLEHGPNELGLLGVMVQPVGGIAPTKFTIRLTASPDGRVSTVVDNAPRSAYLNGDIDPATGQVKTTDAGGQPKVVTPQAIYVESLGVRAWGKAADHGVAATPANGLQKDFAQWGTDCTTPLSASVSIDTYKGVHSEMSSAPFKLTGCESLPFLPSLSIETTEKRPAVPTGVSVTVGLGQTTPDAANPQLSALLKDAVVTMPAGLEIGAQAGSREGGLKLCSAAQFAKDSAAAATCPEGSAAGTVTVISPLQSRPFVGKVFLGEQSAVGELPALYLQMSPEGATAADAPRFKLVGSVKAGADGRLTTTFTDAPQLRFSQLRIDFPSGPDALFSTPRTCGTTSSTSQFTSSASSTPVNVDTSLTIDQDCALPPFAPSISMVPSNNRVGARASTSVTINRADRSPWLTSAKVSLPSGFLADLNVATECPAANAAIGACPDSSRIATVATVAGVGEKPLTLMGKMYLAEREAGAVAGAVIVVPAKIGDIDLGDVVVPARIDLRPTDAGLVLTTAIPTRFRNLALNMRTVVVGLDRDNFPLNPTACGPLRATAQLTGDGGETAAPFSDVTYAGCGDLGLQPGMTAKLSGDTKPNGHPQIDVSITPRPGDTNLSATSVMLPDGLSASLPNVQNPCPTAAWDAGTCPASTKVGSVAATVSITSEVISGDVFLVKVAGKVLPGLGMNFTGRYAQRVLGTVATDSKTGRLVTSFDAIPDLPLTKLNLSVAGGPQSPIVMVPEACTTDSDWKATFKGQGGQVNSQTVPFPCATAAAPKATSKWSSKSGLKITFTVPSGQRLKSAKLTLPNGFKITRSKSGRKRYVKVSAKGGKGKVKYSSRTLSFTAKGSGPTKVTVTLKPKGFKAPKKYLKGGKLKRGKKISVKTRVVSSTASVKSLTTKVKVGK